MNCAILTFFRGQVRSRISVTVWQQMDDPPNLWRGTVTAGRRLIYSVTGGTYDRVRRSCDDAQRSEAVRLERVIADLDAPGRPS